MADIRTGLSDFVKYILKADNSEPLFIDEPIGWNEDNFELSRHDDYHGIFFQIANGLTFKDEAKDYCELAYKVGGINSTLWIQKLVLAVSGDDVKWKEKYIFKADFNTRSIKDGNLTLKFSSNNLAELIKSHESDEFEIERKDSIDDVLLEPLVLNKVELEGRDILEAGESKSAKVWVGMHTDSNKTIPTEVIAVGPKRHSAVLSYSYGSIATMSGANLFYGHTDEIDAAHTLSIRYAIRIIAQSLPDDEILTAKFVKVKWNPGPANFSLVQEYPIFSAPVTYPDTYYDTIEGTLDIENIANDEGIMLAYEGGSNLRWEYQKMWLNRKTFFEKSPSLNFIFTHDLLERLMYIITGKQDSFSSKLLGRAGIKNYIQDGEAGLIGNMSGFWAREFNSDSDKYKSLTTSLKDVFSSLKAVLNVGIAIETVNFKERLRIEDLKHFYRSEVVVKLPYTISDVERKTDSSLFFSGLTFGYEKSRDYDGSMGLDEPNIKVEWVSPIRATNNKFVKTSKIRADDYGLEIARRKPQKSFGQEDTKYDEAIWWLDLKRTDGPSFAQKNYLDRAQNDYLPQGIFSPNTFKGMFFTPLRLLFRHAWVFRSGMEPYLDKYIKYISSTANSELRTWFEGDTKPRNENQDVLISELTRSRFLPETIVCKHPNSEELVDWITGTTKVEVNGLVEDVPNYYFKIEFKNEDGEIERGYLMNMKQGEDLTFTFQKANENLI